MHCHILTSITVNNKLQKYWPKDKGGTLRPERLGEVTRRQIMFALTQLCSPCLATFSSGGHQSSHGPECPRQARYSSLQHVCVLQFDLQLRVVAPLLKQGVKAGKNTSCSSWPKSHTTFSSRKEKSLRLRICWNSRSQNTRESTQGCQLIFTLGEKTISCHLTLHSEHLQTNAKSAGYLPSAASALPHARSVSFSRSAASVKRPLGNPHVS